MSNLIQPLITLLLAAVSWPVPLLIGLIVGAAIATAGLLGYVQIAGRGLLEHARRDAGRERDALVKEASNQARETSLNAQHEAMRLREKAEEQQAAAESRRAAVEAESARLSRDLDARAAKLDRREDALERKGDTLSHMERGLDDRDRALRDRENDLAELKSELDESLAEVKRQLREISGMTEEQAKDALLKRVDDECRAEAGEIVRRRVEEATDEAKERSRTVILEAIQRYAASQCADHTTTSVEIADEAMKGRVIGREGRNIRSFEKATGVDVIIDDTPGVIGLSCFDPVRREVARVSLERLIADGRIHPGRIEEVVVAATDEMQDMLGDLGKSAAHDAHVPNLPRPVVPLLGRLHYRTSYGQNVLRHSQEVAHLTAVMAGELGLDAALAKRAGLLHDIGKAMDHEHEGGHPEIGADLLRKHGEPEAVVNAAAAHHGDVPATTPYTPLVMAADAISASRPGARRESLERYVKRLKELEDLAAEFKGVRQAYAISAGRELRVIADAKAINDNAAAKLARDVAAKIKSTMSFPGEIKVTVLREVRSVEYAR